MPEPEPETGSVRSLQLPGLWILIVGVHVVAAVFAWRMLPHGFGPGHPRFWINEVMPFALVATGVALVIAAWRDRVRLAALTIAAVTALHAGMAAAWAVVFPITGSRLALISAVIAAVLVGCAFIALRRSRGTRRPIAIGAVLGVLVGGVIPWSQRGVDAATHPAGPVSELAKLDAGAPELPAWVHAVPETATFRLEAGTVEIDVHPLLTFMSRSPDRGWTAFADARDRIGPPRRYAGSSANAYHYAGEEPAILRVAAPSDDTLRLEAETVLPAAVYSHLNSFCAIEISGHHRLFIAFSPMPDQRIEVTFSEYPVGRPSRFAYLDAASELHVVEAESGEKGPFTELARGPLAAGTTLGLTLFDEQQPIARIDLADFAAQASTQPSPTAGWGVPENAIELSLSRDRPDAPAAIFITLAGTSVGCGWDSVGHAPGLYRNRIDIRRGGR